MASEKNVIKESYISEREGIKLRQKPRRETGIKWPVRRADGGWIPGPCVNRYEQEKSGPHRERGGGRKWDWAHHLILGTHPPTRTTATHIQDSSSCRFVCVQLRNGRRGPEKILVHGWKVREMVGRNWWLTRRVEFLLLLLLLLNGCRVSLDGCGGWLVTFDTSRCLLLLIPLGRKGPWAGPRRRMIASRRGYRRHSRRTRRSEDQERLGAGWRTDDPWQVVLDAAIYVQRCRIILLRIHRQRPVVVVAVTHQSAAAGRIRWFDWGFRYNSGGHDIVVGGQRFFPVLMFFLQRPSRIVGLVESSSGQWILVLLLLLLLVLLLHVTHGATRRANAGRNGRRRMPHLSLIRPCSSCSRCCCCCRGTHLIRASSFGCRGLHIQPGGWRRRGGGGGGGSWRPSGFGLSHFHDRFTAVSGGGCSSNCWRMMMKGGESASVSWNWSSSGASTRLLRCRHGVGICRKRAMNTTANSSTRTADVSHVTGWINTSAGRN